MSYITIRKKIINHHKANQHDAESLEVTKVTKEEFDEIVVKLSESCILHES